MIDSSIILFFGQPAVLACEQCGGQVPLNVPGGRCIDCGSEWSNFGFQPDKLFYKTMFRGTLLWAYNRAHLVLILRYIEALQRTKVSPRHENGMAGVLRKLPKQIISKKNRAAVVKAITRLLHST